MKKTIYFWSVVCISIIGVAFAMPKVTSASNTYQVGPSMGYNQSFNAWHLKSTKQNVYMWNKSHTKVIDNLKNYPNATWGIGFYETIFHNQKNYTYWRVSSSVGDKKFVVGWVYSKYFVIGRNPNYYVQNNLDPSEFVSVNDYQNYINESPSQWLSRKVEALFPKCQLSQNLSSAICDNDFYQPAEFSSLPNNYTNIIYPTSVNKYFLPDYGRKSKLSDVAKLMKIKTALNAFGLTATKRNSMNDYQIGIFYYYHWGYNITDRGYGLMLAKPVIQVNQDNN